MSTFRRQPDSRRAALCFRCSPRSDNSARRTSIVGPHLRPSGTRGAPLSPGSRNRWNDRPGWPAASHCQLVPWRTDSFPSSVRPTPAERCWCPFLVQTDTGGPPLWSRTPFFLVPAARRSTYGLPRSGTGTRVTIFPPLSTVPGWHTPRIDSPTPRSHLCRHTSQAEG